MNFNILGYTIYLFVTIFIIFKVGMVFYRNGYVFILSLFHGDTVFTNHVNKVLLLGYYLLNIGYAFLSIRMWSAIVTVQYLISELAFRIGGLMALLALMHYFNMLVLYLLSHSKNKLFHHE